MEEQPVAERVNSLSHGKKVFTVVFSGLVLLAVVIAGLWYWYDVRTSISTDDAIVTGNIADISPKIAGRLDKLYVSQGDVVTIGEKLAELDQDQLLVALKQAEAALDLANADYTKVPNDIKAAEINADKAQQGLLVAQDQEKIDENTLNDATRVLNEIKSLYDSGATSKENLDSTTSAFNKAQTALDAEKVGIRTAQDNLQAAQVQFDSVTSTEASTSLAAVKQAQAAYESANLNYENSFIYATINGTVIRVPAAEGEILSAGTPILSVSDLSTTWIVANVDEGSYSRIQLGEKVDVKVDAYPGLLFTGMVVDLGGATQSTFNMIPVQNDSGNFTKITQRMPIKIQIDQKQLQNDGIVLKPGLSAKVKIYTT